MPLNPPALKPQVPCTRLAEYVNFGSKTPSRSFGAGTRNVEASGGFTDAGTTLLWNVSASSAKCFDGIKNRNAIRKGPKLALECGTLKSIVISHIFAPDGNCRFNISSRLCVPLQV